MRNTISRKPCKITRLQNDKVQLTSDEHCCIVPITKVFQAMITSRNHLLKGTFPIVVGMVIFNVSFDDLIKLWSKTNDGTNEA